MGGVLCILPGVDDWPTIDKPGKAGDTFYT